MLEEKWKQWALWIKSQFIKGNEPRLPLHCTLYYDKQQENKDYEECWDELLNKNGCAFTAEDIYLGLQGAASAVNLPSQWRQWFQVSESTHVTLYIADGHESHELGPMVRRVLQVQEWIPTYNQYIHLSPDGQFARILIKTFEECFA